MVHALRSMSATLWAQMADGSDGRYDDQPRPRRGRRTGHELVSCRSNRAATDNRDAGCWAWDVTVCHLTIDGSS